MIGADSRSLEGFFSLGIHSECRSRLQLLPVRMCLCLRACLAGDTLLTPVNLTEVSKLMSINKTCLDALAQEKVGCKET